MKNMSQIWKIWAKYEKYEPDMRFFRIWLRFSIFGSDFPYLAQIFWSGSDFQCCETNINFPMIWHFEPGQASKDAQIIGCFPNSTPNYFFSWACSHFWLWPSVILSNRNKQTNCDDLYWIIILCGGGMQRGMQCHSFSRDLVKNKSTKPRLSRDIVEIIQSSQGRGFHYNVDCWIGKRKWDYC